MMVYLKNSFLTVEISTLGAELKSIKNTAGKEFLWQGDKNVWAGQAPVLFPITGGLKDDKYILNGKEYTLQKHGYARFSEFEPEKKSDSSATFKLNSNNESLKAYPFNYELRIIYTLIDNAVEVKYSVINKSKETMYFSIGAHEGYSCPEGIEEYSIVFDKHETINAFILNGNLLEHNSVKILDNEKELPLDYKYFKVDALVFKDVKSRTVTLKHNKSNKEVKVDFDGFNYFLLWTKPDAKYICIEPWCGIQDAVDSTYDITKKEGIEKLAQGAAFERVHKITIKD